MFRSMSAVMALSVVLAWISAPAAGPAIGYPSSRARPRRRRPPGYAAAARGAA